MTDRDILLAEANELQLEFPNNIPTLKLQQIIAESKSPTTKPEVEVEETTITEPTAVTTTTPKRALSKRSKLRQKIAQARAKAMKMVVVTITNKDSRENDVMTTVSLGFENQYFGISRIVPLDIPVEVEQALVDLAEGTMMTLHKTETLNGKPTGNKVAVTVKKFAISYARQNIE